MYPACGWDPSCSRARDMPGSGISAEYVPIRHMLNLESVIIQGSSQSHASGRSRGLPQAKF